MRPSFMTRRSAINRCREVLGAALAWPALLEFDVRRDQIPSGSAPASESILSRTGINLRATELDPQTLQTVRAYGFGWIRTDLSWQRLEPRVNEFAFGTLRQGLRAAVEHGLKVLGILDYGHPLYTGMLAPQNDHQRTAFTRFAEEAFRELGSLVSAWEVWNEPNHPRFWPPKPDVGAFTLLLSQVAAALWRLNPSAVLVSGGLSTVDKEFLSGLVPVVESLAQRGEIGLGLHPYRSTPPETLVADLRRVGLLRDDGRATTGGGVPVWLSEWGYCRGNPGVGPDGQAEWTTRIPLVGAALGVPLTVLFELRDGGPQGTAAYTCGMLSARDEPYPVGRAWTTLKAAAAKVAPVFRHIPTGNDLFWSVGSCDNALIWTDDGSQSLPGMPITCDMGSNCSTGVRSVSPAREHWTRLGHVCS